MTYPLQVLLDAAGIKTASGASPRTATVPAGAGAVEAAQRARAYEEQVRRDLQSLGMGSTGTHPIPVDMEDVLDVEAEDDDAGLELTRVMAYPVEPEDGIEEE